MRKVLGLTAAALLVASAGLAQVLTSKHDLRVGGGGTPTGQGLLEVCVVCHTPHQATAANSQDPLWNHTGTATAAFGVYDSGTMDHAPAEIGGAAMGAQSVSLLCMSCHDGTVSVLSMYNNPNGGIPTVVPIAGRIDATGHIISNANMGTSLVDDHPINFTYTDGLDPELYPPTDPDVAPLLINGEVQCSSCHDPHAGTALGGVQFMVMDNTASALCLTCHIK